MTCYADDDAGVYETLEQRIEVAMQETVDSIKAMENYKTVAEVWPDLTPEAQEQARARANKNEEIAAIGMQWLRERSPADAQKIEAMYPDIAPHLGLSMRDVLPGISLVDKMLAEVRHEIAAQEYRANKQKESA